ncbi:MAG: hypothetical protein HZA11_10765 [Nitrospirae bacterium]|nr:hypothetical protein [Nitrospirota bacterium]
MRLLREGLRTTIFDFRHVANQKELKETIQKFSKTSDEPTLRLALKVIQAVSR